MPPECHNQEPRKDHRVKTSCASTSKQKTIAVVGASANEHKATHIIPRYLQSQGYRIIPVNPEGGEILG